MVERIARLVNDEGYSGYDFLVLTFTRKAAQNMRIKLLNQIPQSEVLKMRIGTFHSQSLRILREWGDTIGYREGIVVYDPADQRDIFESVIKGFKLKCKWSHFDNWYSAWASGTPIEFESRDLKMAWTEYRARLMMNNAVDFGLILSETLRLFENPKCQEYYHNKFKHIMVDEYQDTDYTQYALHRAIEPQNLFVVGDPDQNIYHWRGSAIDIILGFTERDYPDGEMVTLSTNYRSYHPIVRAANNLIDHNTDRFPKTLVAWRTGASLDYSISVQGNDTRDEEAERVAQMVNTEIMDTDIKPGEIAVLARTNKQLWDLKREFAKTGVPFKVITSKGMFWGDHYVKQLTSMLRLAHDIRDEQSLYKVLNFPEKRVSDLQMKQIRKYALMNDLTLFQAMEKMENVDGKAKQFVETTKRLNTLSTTMHVRDLFEEALNLYKVREFAEGKELAHRLELIQEYIDEIDSWTVRQTLNISEYDESVFDFLGWIATRELQDYIEDEDNVVKIMTIHASKGLEWPSVYIVGCVEGILPGRPTEIEEERRLFYVAMTRAMDRLVFSYYREEINQYSGERQEREYSRYLTEMDG